MPCCTSPDPTLWTPYSHPLRSIKGIYVLSASERCDDANQWRLYAGGGRGYAIELDPRVRLTTVLDHEPETPDVDPTDAFAASFADAVETVAVTPWLKVLYSSQEKDAALAQLVANAHEMRRCAAGEATDGDDFDERIRETETDMLGHLAQLAQLMKSAGFSGESEYRMIVSDWADRHRNFRDTPHGVVRYARLTQNQSTPGSRRIAYKNTVRPYLTLPVRSVWLGPLLHTVNNRDTIEALLEEAGHASCPVHDSRVPLGF